MEKFLVVYYVKPFNSNDGMRGRYVEALHYDAARDRMRALGFKIYREPFGLLPSQIDEEKLYQRG